MTKDADNFNIVSETIGNILSKKNHRVPPSQRSYKWEDEHINDLYQDINGEIQNSSDEYFLGSIVAVKSLVSRF